MKATISPEPALLGFLRDAPLHGYDLHKQVNANLGAVWRLGLSQMYAILKDYEARGWIKTVVMSQASRPARKVMKLTRQAQRAFDAWMNQSARGVREFRVDFFARLYFARASGRPTLRAFLKRQLAATGAEYAELQKAEPLSDFDEVVRSFRRTQLETMMEWLAGYETNSESRTHRGLTRQLNLRKSELKARIYCVTVLVWLAACATPTPMPAPTPTAVPPVFVYADTLLTDALRGVRGEFLSLNPNAGIELEFVESDAMPARLASSVNANLALSAAPDVFQELANHGRLEGEAQVFAVDPLAIIIARTNPEGILELQDLNRTGLRIAIASEDTLLGQQTRLLIANLNELPRFRTDFTDQVLNSVIAQPSNGGAILNLVESHQADVGIVFASQAVLEQKRVFVLEVPPQTGVSVEYSVGALKTNRDSAHAQQFLDFLVSPRGQDVLMRYGFKPPY